MVLEHLGALHGVEKLLVLLLAFGPFAMLAVVLAVVRRRDAEATGPVAGTSPREGADPLDDAGTTP